MTSASVCCDSPALAPPRARKLFFRYVGVAFAALLALCIAAYIFRAPLLTGIAKAWVVDDPVTKVDAIVVLGGNPDVRAVGAARLYLSGAAPKIVYMNPALRPIAKLGLAPSEGEQTRRLIMSMNIPESAIEGIGDSLTSTHEEAEAVRVWAAKSGVKSILIATDLAHTRRARWIFDRALKTTEVRVTVNALAPPEYGVNNWYKHEQGLIAFQNEFIKYIFYRWRY